MQGHPIWKGHNEEFSQSSSRLLHKLVSYNVTKVKGGDWEDQPWWAYLEMEIFDGNFLMEGVSTEKRAKWGDEYVEISGQRTSVSSAHSYIGLGGPAFFVFTCKPRLF